MQFNKTQKIIDLLKAKDPSIEFEKLQCWIKPEADYNIYIFTVQLKGENELKNLKDDLRDYLAIYFQSQTLEKDVERWNIYQVFFVEESVGKDIKLQIEQDKFATRKLVFDNVGKDLADEEIERKLNTTIFHFELSSSIKTNEKLEDALGKEDLELYYNIEKADGKIDELLNELENE